MRTNSRILIVAASVLALAISPAVLNAQGRGAAPRVPTNNPPPTSPVSGDATAGKTLFFNYNCYACHGYNGETGARPFVGNWGHLGTEQEFLTFLRQRANVAPENKSTQMPNFPENSLPDKQALDIYAYIRSFKSNAPPLKDIPTLNAIMEAAQKPATK